MPKIRTWRDFVDIDAIAMVSKHVSGALAVILGFVLIEAVVGWFVHDVSVEAWVHYAERVIVGACIVRAVLIMLWKIVTSTLNLISPGGDGNGGHSSSILVA